MIKKLHRYSGPIKWAGTLLIPAVLISFWLGVGSLLGQDSPPNVSGIASPEAALPTIGTSLTAGGVFYLVMAFLQRTIDRYELNLKDKDGQWQNLLALAYRDRDVWAAKYHEIVNDILDDTKSLRLAQTNKPKPPRRQS